MYKRGAVALLLQVVKTSPRAHAENWGLAVWRTWAQTHGLDPSLEGLRPFLEWPRISKWNGLEFPLLYAPKEGLHGGDGEVGAIHCAPTTPGLCQPCSEV